LENNNDLFSTIFRLVRREPQIVIVTADNGFTNFNTFQTVFPDRFLNFGIAEGNMNSFAAGMASCGRIPFIFAITTFLTMRAYEQIRNDICLAGRNVKLIGVGAGLYYSKLGNSHHAIEDIALFSVLPNMTIFCPCNTSEMQEAIMAAKDINGPVYIRFNNDVEISEDLPKYSFEAGKGVLIRDGQDITLITTGDMIYDVSRAAKILEEQGISSRIIHMHTIKPLDREMVLTAARETGAILTVEEHSTIGGLGSIVADSLVQSFDTKARFDKVGIDDFYPIGYGTLEEMKKLNGLSIDSIVEKAINLVAQK
jgi:transketolase